MIFFIIYIYIMGDETDEFIRIYSEKIRADEEQIRADKELSDKIEELKRDTSIQANVKVGIKNKKDRIDNPLDKETENKAYDAMFNYINDQIGPDAIGGRGKKYRRSKKKHSHKISKTRRKKSMRKKKTRRR